MKVKVIGSRYLSKSGSVRIGSFLALILLAVCIITSLTHARRPIRRTFFQAYPQAKGSIIDDANSHAEHCGVCHYDFGGSGPKNPYGEDVAATDLSREAILLLGGLDSDGDGFTNDQEITDTATFINTPTFPGLTLANISLTVNVDTTDIETFLVPSTGVDTNGPNVVVLVPDGGETYIGNVNDVVLWNANDSGGIAAIDLYISLDNGVTFKPIELGVPNTGSYDWFPANRPTVQAILRVIATDNSFNKSQDDSNSVFTIISPAGGIAPTTLRDFDQPGSQPFEAGTLNVPQGCAGCHGDYDPDVEPYRNWQGSMMAQASIDPLFKANMAIANQDAPDSGDLCLRCHFVRGWLQGRSVPTDGSRMQKLDEGGVACDFCHRLVDPIHDPCESPAEDAAVLAALSFPAFEFGNGMATVDTISSRRGPFPDANSGHNVIFSPFHREAALCGTCHDVSNPAFENDGSGNFIPNDFDAPAADFSPHTLAPVERTYSEWLNSRYNTPGGVYAPQFGGNKDYVSTCQDCHMRDVTGHGCNYGTPPLRTDLPLHDMTGGSTWLPGLLSTTNPNDVNDAAMQAGIARARYMLQNAATLTAVQQNSKLKVTVTNNTGHKLPTGYPEGRRVWLNVKFFNDSNSLISESGAYDFGTGVLSHDEEAKIYHIEPGIDETVAGALGLESGPSLHFVLNNKIYLDNRIPPRGFTNEAFAAFGGAPVDYNYPDGHYWDDTYYNVPDGATRSEVTLYYQSTSKEFIEFLRDENYTTNDGNDIYNLWNDNGKCPPELMQSVLMPLQMPGDFDGLNGVDFVDFGTFAAYWRIDCTVGDCGPANLDDSDNIVNWKDLDIFINNWLWGK